MKRVCSQTSSLKMQLYVCYDCYCQKSIRKQIKMALIKNRAYNYTDRTLFKGDLFA